LPQLRNRGRFSAQSQRQLAALELQLVHQLAHVCRQASQIFDRAQCGGALRSTLRVVRDQRGQDQRAEDRHSREQDELEADRQSTKHVGGAEGLVEPLTNGTQLKMLSLGLG
jgi:hypothetical protein